MSCSSSYVGARRSTRNRKTKAHNVSVTDEENDDVDSFSFEDGPGAAEGDDSSASSYDCRTPEKTNVFDKATEYELRESSAWAKWIRDGVERSPPPKHRVTPWYVEQQSHGFNKKYGKTITHGTLYNRYKGMCQWRHETGGGENSLRSRIIDVMTETEDELKQRREKAGMGGKKRKRSSSSGTAGIRILDNSNPDSPMVTVKRESKKVSQGKKGTVAASAERFGIEQGRIVGRAIAANALSTQNAQMLELYGLQLQYAKASGQPLPAPPSSLPQITSKAITAILISDDDEENSLKAPKAAKSEQKQELAQEESTSEQDHQTGKPKGKDKARSRKKK